MSEGVVPWSGVGTHRGKGGGHPESEEEEGEGGAVYREMATSSQLHSSSRHSGRNGVREGDDWERSRSARRANPYAAQSSTSNSSLTSRGSGSRGGGGGGGDGREGIVAPTPFRCVRSAPFFFVKTGALVMAYRSAKRAGVVFARAILR